MNRDFIHQHHRWMVASLPNTSVGLSAGPNAELAFFSLRHAESERQYYACFTGYGLGVDIVGMLRTLKLVSKPVADVLDEVGSFVQVPLSAHEAIPDKFSLAELDGAGGRQTSCAAGFGLSYGFSWITAFTTNRVLFESHYSEGASAGSAMPSASVTAGLWNVLDVDA